MMDLKDNAPSLTKGFPRQTPTLEALPEASDSTVVQLSPIRLGVRSILYPVFV